MPGVHWCRKKSLIEPEGSTKALILMTADRVITCVGVDHPPDLVLLCTRCYYFVCKVTIMKGTRWREGGVRRENSMTFDMRGHLISGRKFDSACVTRSSSLSWCTNPCSSVCDLIRPIRPSLRSFSTNSKVKKLITQRRNFTTIHFFITH